MLVSTVAGSTPQASASSRACAWSSAQPVDVVVERVEPGRGQDADLAHPAAHPLAADPRLRRSRSASRRPASPTGRPAPWTGTRPARPRTRRTPRAGRRWRRGRSRAAPRRGGRRTPTEPAQVRSARRSSSGSTAPAGEVVGVLDRDRGGADEERPHVGGVHLLRSPRGRSARAGARQVRMVSPVSAPWAPSSARAMWAEASQSTSWPGDDQRGDGQHVGHRAGGREERVLEAEQVGHPSLQGVDGGVLAVDVVAHLGLGHGTPHAGGGTGQGVGAQVDGHGPHASGACGEASVEMLQPRPEPRPRSRRPGADRDRQALLLVVDADPVVEPWHEPSTGRTSAAPRGTGPRRPPRW